MHKIKWLFFELEGANFTYHKHFNRIAPNKLKWFCNFAPICGLAGTFSNPCRF